MNMPALNSNRVFEGNPWAWAAFLALTVLPGCKQPAEVDCQPEGYFRLVEPERKAGAAPFGIDRLGTRVNEPLAFMPAMVIFKERNRPVVSWISYGHSTFDVTYIYSPEEGLARNSRNPDDVLPMKWLSDERLLLGFQSQICLDGKAGVHRCMFGDYSQDERPFAADMTCWARPQLYYPTD